ncbi:MAG: sigma 54-interacting transcriptional regulator [Myxococcota bacterium]
MSTTKGGTQVVVRGLRQAVAVHNYTVRATRGPDEGKHWEVSAPRAVIGCGEGADVVLTDDTVSRRHCELSVQDDRYVLRDLSSTNGTMVDDVEIIQAFVSPGSGIRVGQSELCFEPRVEWRMVQPERSGSFGDLVGESEAMKTLYSVLDCVATTRLTVLFQGDTGTGKEIAARALHRQSDRRAGPFVVLDCGIVGHELIESELFGHEKGAFTGADQARAGCFEAARGGTVLIDEIGELPLHLQPKLLRVLERREVRRLGGSRMIDVDVRVVAATLRNLADMVEKGTFREDLYYRLAEVVVQMPSLHERQEDVPLLAKKLLEMEARGERSRTLTTKAEAWLEQRSYPGNVRELRTLLRRALAFGEAETIRVDDLLEAEKLGGHGYRREELMSVEQIAVGDDRPIKEARREWLSVLEPRYLRGLVERFGGDLASAAKHAELHERSLLRLHRQYELKQ